MDIARLGIKGLPARIVEGTVKLLSERETFNLLGALPEERHDREIVLEVLSLEPDVVRRGQAAGGG
jgi:hypothetical protein